MDFEITPIRNFEDYIEKVRSIFNMYRPFPTNDIKKYEELEKTFEEMVNGNNPEREESVLDFLIETNVAEFATHEFAVLKLNQNLCEKNDVEKYQILKKFQNRLHKLEYKPNFQHLQIYSTDRILFAPLYTLNKYVKEELSKYDSVKFDKLDVATKPEKIKTNLSVPQISLLFKLLADEGIIERVDKAKLSRQIAATFSSTEETDISESTLRNKFYKPNKSVIDFWDTKFVRLKQLLIKYSDENKNKNKKSKSAT